MQQCLYLCPQCGRLFEWRDGYPDLYNLKLCSPGCQEQWLIRYRYRSTLSDDLLAQIADDFTQQGNDGVGTVVQDGDPERLEDPHRQME